MGNQQPAPWTLADILKATGGELLSGDPMQGFENIGIDSRDIRAQDVFVAIAGDVHDGHTFANDVVEQGVSGLIVPDLPPDEGGDLEAAAKKRDMGLIYLLAPTATDERVRLAADHSTGFLYLVSLAGVTGARTTLPEGLEDFVDRVRAAAKQPLCVGFGVSSAEQAARVASIADGVIVGSRILQLAEEDPTLKRVAAFVHDLRVAVDSVGS